MKQNLLGKFLLPVVLTVTALSFSACSGNEISESSLPPSQVQSENEASSVQSSQSSEPAESTTLNAVEEAEDAVFNNAVFVGDSVSLKLNLFVSAQRKENPNFFGTAQFLTPGSYGSGNELKKLGSENSVHPSYNGTEMYLADAIAQMGATKVFIMLGMNDIAVYGIDGAVQNMETVLAQIKEKSPGTMIYVQSMTPIVESAQKGDLTNANLNLYNTALQVMCRENDYIFLDVASVMKDDSGSLKREYCSDPDNMGVHFTDTGCQAWIAYLRTHIA